MNSENTVGLVPFTQYLMPDGRTAETGVMRPTEIVAMADEVIDAGGRFIAEVLFDHQTVSLSCERPWPGNEDETQVLSNGLCENGPDVPEAVDKLVKDAYKKIEKE